ncbi:ABC transporter ATP-binding protein [Photobacterium galatheae]|nr:ABC transporter ATP-binding protein [Photobacterium galatheae]MCM0149860.1 ABC transporter ATP-binding protein [Photobacterium galatheae]
MTTAIVLLAIAAFVHMMIPWFLSKIIDDGLMKFDRDALIYWGGALALVSAVNPIAYALGYRVMALLEARARRQVNHRINNNVSFPGVAPRTSSMGETVNVVTGDNEVLASVFSTIGHGVMNLIAFTLGVILVWQIHMWLGIAIAIGVIATTVIAGPLLGKLEQRWTNYRGTLATTTDFAADTIRGLRVLRGIGGENKFLARYQKQSRDLLEDSYKLSNQSSWIHALQQAIPLTYMVAIIWLGARLTFNGDISVGELSAAFGYATGLVMYSGSLLGTAHSVVSIRVAAVRISRYLSGDRSLNTESQAPEQTVGNPIVVDRGQLTVIVPAKMSAAKQLLMDFAESDDARDTILVSDTDYIFSGTLLEALNTTQGDYEASLAAVNGQDIQSSIESASDQMVHDKGLNLSGGQRQRLILARAIARQSETLLLCDPTSALDAVTELSIARQMKESRSGKTTIVVSGSLIWQSYADSVIHLRDADCEKHVTLKHNSESVQTHPAMENLSLG